MVDPQENIAIGSFLYGLGLCIGVRAGTGAPYGAVSLLQQTSYDKALGDVMLSFTGATRLLEFKRRRNPAKERSKHSLICAALQHLPQKRATSRVVHWYVETAPGREGFVFDACPYLDMRDLAVKRTEFKLFVDELVTEALASAPKIANHLANEYVRDVVETWGSAGPHSATGLLVSVSSSGGLAYAVVDDLADLGRTGAKCLELQTQRHLAIEQAMRAAHAAQQYQQAAVTLEHQPVQRHPTFKHELTR